MPPPDLPVGIFAGHRIVRPIASGGAGSVLLATSADGAPRALKLVARSGIAEQLFAQEIAALRALADVPQVVHYRAHGETEEWLWLTLEWLEGDTLARVLERDGLSLARTTAVGLELSHALVALHERGIVHRDLKPSNVMCCSDGRVKLLDFGIAADSGRPLSHWGPGTPGYMAPEQARGGGTVDARSDLFALGCILFELLTGRPAFAWRGRTATLARVVLQEVPRVSELRPGTPAPLVDLVGRLLAKDPEARPRSAAEVREILTSVAAQDGQADVVLRPPPAPDNGEQRVLSVIAVRASETAAETLVEEPADDDDDLLAILSEAALRHRGQLEPLVDWTSMVILSDTLAHELAQRAMRCAEEIQEAAPWARVAVATGQATWAGGQPVGEVTDSVLAALAAATPGQLRSDAMTRTLAGLASATPRRTNLVGRRAELRRLVAALRAVVRQRSAAKLVVAGRPGQGKSA